MQQNPSDPWRITLVKNRFLWMTDPIRPADMSDRLRGIMLAKENLIEDAQYRKMVPNRFVVEVSEQNYARYYQPIEPRILQQWRERLLEDLETANSRLGRREYSFAGRVEIQIRPAQNLAPNQARVYSQHARTAGQAFPQEMLLPACLELVHGISPVPVAQTQVGGKRWRLHRGTVTIGRDENNDVFLDLEETQERRLVSGRHAYLRCDERECWLFDGSPDGKASINGTFVNSRPVPSSGRLLADGDTILLAALDPGNPRPDMPGTVTLVFRQECPA